MRLGPEGIDVYYDYVGGEQLETALTRMKDYGQVIASGMIAPYHQPWAARTALHIVYKRFSVNGFIYSDSHMLQKYMPTFPTDMATWIVQGKVKTKEDVVKGIENAPEALVSTWTGDKFGKMVIEA
jgi:NADPH-dependent curcumin reductase CurA